MSLGRWYIQAPVEIDDWLLEHRDKQRFRMKDSHIRKLQTHYGIEITFRRRHLDRQTGKPVYLLDEVL